MADKKDFGDVVPRWSPPFSPGPYVMDHWEGIIVELEVPREQIEYMTPAPLEPAAHNRIYAVIVDACQTPHSLFYHEALICHETTFKGQRGLHIPYIWTSTDTAMLVGRELFGMPKLMCDHGKLQIYGNEVVGDLKRSGLTMMEAAVVIDRKIGAAELPDFSTWMMVRHIPTPDPAYKARSQVVRAICTDFKLFSAFEGRGWARMGYPSSSGLHRISTDRPIKGFYGKFGWVLGVGKILEEIEY